MEIEDSLENNDGLQVVRELQASIVRFIEQSLEVYATKKLSIGKIEPFNEKMETWTNYIERFELYCEANDVPAQKKSVMLLTAMGSKLYNKFRDICLPEKPRHYGFEKIVQMIGQHLEPKSSTIYMERLKFGNCRQEENELLRDYIEKLKQLALKCDYSGEDIMSRLRDQFLLGLKSERIRNRLLIEKHLTWNKSVKIAAVMNDEFINDDDVLKMQLVSKPVENQTENFKGRSESTEIRGDQKETRRSGRITKRHEAEDYAYENLTAKRQKINNERKETSEDETEMHNLKLENKKLRLELEETNRMQKELTVLNRDLQSRLVNDYEELRTSLANVCATDVNHQQLTDVFLPIGYVRRLDKNVHLGRDVWIPKSTYDTVMCTARNPSIFIKNMALAVFGHETLERSSVTGQLSNRTRKFYEGPPKQKLDPTKLLAIKDVFRYWLQEIKKVDECTTDIELRKVGSYIGHKIADLNRRKKDTEETQRSSEDFNRTGEEFQRAEQYQRTPEIYHQNNYQRDTQSAPRSTTLVYDRNSENYDMLMVNVKSETNEANEETLNCASEAVFITEEDKQSNVNGLSVDDVNDDVNNVEDDSFISYL
ncbi:uncharacterized protein LOC122501696 [Leptopilina heterotoma]|uniref:uncharacterized protein LOC122501696 n=1 Tax=Leptopilina heterotoma TaxID=63436 RepID=UPI001CA905F8|nr:uncharacterized protein LOC122501696 [Leptopilina heterotoma]